MSRKAIKKKNIERVKGIPDSCPLQCYFPTPEDIPISSPLVMVGMDSGVSNTAFAYIELVQGKQTKGIVDFKFGDAYYFKDDLDLYSLQKDKQFFLCQQYYQLFSHKLVESLSFELLPLTTIKDYDTLKGVLDAQSTTDMISTVAFQLRHYYTPIPPTSVKYCLTGNGKATKEEMCKAAFSLTGDKRLLDNDHMADSFACCFYSFIQKVKEDCVYFGTPIPQKFASMDWNFRVMPAPPWGYKG